MEDNIRIDSKIVKKFVNSIKIDEDDEYRIQRIKNLYLQYTNYIKKSKSNCSFEDFLELDPAIVLSSLFTKEEINELFSKLSDAFEESLRINKLNVSNADIDILKMRYLDWTTIAFGQVVGQATYEEFKESQDAFIQKFKDYIA